MQKIRLVRDADVSGKRVVMRVDFNVPLKDGVITDDTRIKAALPTIALLLEKGAAHITLLTHLGRPEGKVVDTLRVLPIAERLTQLLSPNSTLQRSSVLASTAPDHLQSGASAAYQISDKVTLQENVRFNAGEEANDPAYAQELAQLGDIFVNDAFADSHRAHASVVGVARLLPSYAGLLIEKEIQHLQKALTPPPGSVAVIGGAKFETKQPLIEKLLTLYSKVLLGGALGNDVVKSRGLPVGTSLVSSMPVPTSIASNENLVVAKDFIVSNNTTEEVRSIFESDTRIEEKIVDIGPASAVAWGKLVAAAPFVLWNGPLGMYEDGFTGATDTVASALAAANVEAVVGGGDTIAAVAKANFNPEKVFLSTGGGAMLEYLANGTLPGIEVLGN